MTVVSTTPPPLAAPVQQVIPYVVDVDLHPARPGRGSVAGILADPNIDEAPQRTSPAHLVAEEFGARADADLKIEDERLALARAFRIERRFILYLKAVEHADDRLLDDDSQIEGALISGARALIAWWAGPKKGDDAGKRQVPAGGGYPNAQTRHPDRSRA